MISFSNLLHNHKENEYIWLLCFRFSFRSLYLYILNAHAYWSSTFCVTTLYCAWQYARHCVNIYISPKPCNNCKVGIIITIFELSQIRFSEVEELDHFRHFKQGSAFQPLIWPQIPHTSQTKGVARWYVGNHHWRAFYSISSLLYHSI